MKKALKNFKRNFLLGFGKGNTEPNEVTIALAVEQKYVLVSTIEEQQFSLEDWRELTKDQLYLFVKNAQIATIQAARAYKARPNE